MVIIKEIDAIPRWWQICRAATISKLLDCLEDQLTLHVSVHLWQGKAFIIVKKVSGTNTFLQMSEKFWRDAKHIMDTRPLFCQCWRCKWRLRRKRYTNVRTFEHIYYIDSK